MKSALLWVLIASLTFATIEATERKNCLLITNSFFSEIKNFKNLHLEWLIQNFSF